MSTSARKTRMATMGIVVVVVVMMVVVTDGYDTNNVYGACWDTKIQRRDGFTMGLAFSSKESFFFNQVQLSPCDRRLGFPLSNAKLAVFRPKVDEISLLTINSSDTPFSPGHIQKSGPYLMGCMSVECGSFVNFIFSVNISLLMVVLVGRMLRPDPNSMFHWYIKFQGWEAYSWAVWNILHYPDMYGGYMVAFAGRMYAARSLPTFVANGDLTITSFTLILEFQKGTLQNLYWKQDGCASCSGKSAFICVSQMGCAIRTSSCKSHGGSVDCGLGIQVAFSGTDRNDAVLNSWYEVAHLTQFSLYNLYSDLRDSFTSQYNDFF